MYRRMVYVCSSCDKNDSKVPTPTPYPRSQADTNIAAARGLSGVRIAGVCEDAVSLGELEVKMDEEAEYECKGA